MAHIEIDCNFLGNWSLNYNYWTAGINLSDGAVWCPGLEPISNASANIFGYSSPGNKGKECVQLKISREAISIFKWRLQFKNCKERLIFACEVCKLGGKHHKSVSFLIILWADHAIIELARSQAHPTKAKAGKQKLHKGLCEECFIVRAHLPIPER